MLSFDVTIVKPFDGSGSRALRPKKITL